MNLLDVFCISWRFGECKQSTSLMETSFLSEAYAVMAFDQNFDIE